MITLMFANKGTGKTTYLAKICQKELNRKKKKYTQVFCNVPIYGAIMFDVQQHLGRFDLPRKSLVLIDEGAIFLPNTSNLTREQALYFILSRHAEVDFVLISQSWEDLNIKIRRLFDKIYFAKRMFLLPDVTVFHQYKKRLEIDEETHQFVDGYYKTFFFPGLTRKFVYRPKYYKYFDSYDMPTVGPVMPIKEWDCELPPTRLSKLLYWIDAKYNSLLDVNERKTHSFLGDALKKRALRKSCEADSQGESSAKQ